MKNLMIGICLFLLCTTAEAKETIYCLCRNSGCECTSDNPEANVATRAEFDKSKRQELIEKCDEYLKLAKNGRCHCEGEGYCDCKDDISSRTLDANIAQAYCLRAQLENE